MTDLPRFGANDFYLVEMDALALREQLRASLAEILGRDVLDSDPHMVLASAFLPYLVQGQASADAAAKATLRAFAVGADLDRIADSTCVVGYMNRLPARGAVLACILTATITRPSFVNVGTVTLTWEASRTVTVDGEDIEFTASGEFEIPFDAAVSSKAVSVPIYLISSVPGSAYNGLFPPASALPVVDSDIVVSASAADESGADCTVSGVIVSRCGSTYNGSDVESDDSFAERVGWQAKALRVPGSYEYFELALSEIHLLASCYIAPRVDSDGRIVTAWCDKAAYYAENAGITLDLRGAAYDEFRLAIQGSLLVEQRVTAYPALASSAAYVARYWLPSNTTDIASARKAIEAAWITYVSEHAWHCGIVLSITEMAAVLKNAGATRVSIYTDAQSYNVLPADTMLPESRITLIYAGQSTDSEPPAGSDGEEITP